MGESISSLLVINDQKSLVALSWTVLAAHTEACPYVLICMTVCDTELRRLQSLASNCHTTLTSAKRVPMHADGFRLLLSI